MKTSYMSVSASSALALEATIIQKVEPTGEPEPEAKSPTHRMFEPAWRLNLLRSILPCNPGPASIYDRIRIFWVSILNVRVNSLQGLSKIGFSE